MPIFHSRLFPESPHAHRLLQGLRGVEIGGSAHNAFGLDMLNIDYNRNINTVYKQHEYDLCGDRLTVDVVAHGHRLPFADGTFDFVLASHVIEHFFDPAGAIKEWVRVARQYVYLIVPQRDALEDDAGRPLTTLQELKDRHCGRIAPPATHVDKHWSIWTSHTFGDLCRDCGVDVLDILDPDDKVGNGFTVVLRGGPPHS